MQTVSEKAEAIASYHQGRAGATATDQVTVTQDSTDLAQMVIDCNSLQLSLQCTLITEV